VALCGTVTVTAVGTGTGTGTGIATRVTDRRVESQPSHGAPNDRENGARKSELK